MIYRLNRCAKYNDLRENNKLCGLGNALRFLFLGEERSV